MSYPMGNQPFPGGGAPGQGAGWGPPPGGVPGGPPGQQGAWGQMQQNFMGPQNPVGASQHYGSYGQTFAQNVFQINAAQALGYSSDAELQALFESKKSQRFQAIQAQELMQILNESANIRNYYRINWSLELCKIMSAMLDRSKDGMMQYPEFCELLQCLTYWYQCFCQYDTNRSGYIEAHELGRVIGEKFGYTLTQASLTTLLKRYSRAMDDGRLLIAFDDFVSLAVRLRAYTEAFRARDKMANGGYETGRCTFTYDDFLQCVMCL